jgi:ribosome-binding ATPase
MGFNCGIVGLPNVGKSTLFNALTAAGAAASNYPFCTIDPNIGIVALPDPRLDTLAGIYGSQRSVPTSIEFVDIAGLVRGASKGEGLGNQFLSHIREVDAIAHVVRCFESADVVHVDGALDPRRDIEVVETELILKDLDTIDRRLQDEQRRARSGDKKARAETQLCERLREHLHTGALARTCAPHDADEVAVLQEMHLLTAKPVMFICNVGEQDSVRGDSWEQEVRAMAAARGACVVTVSAEIEAEVAVLPEDQRKDFLEGYGLRESGLSRVIREGYALLDLITFFTASAKEAHAWTVHRGTTAVHAAGSIHSDFERGFIRAEVMHCNVLFAHGSEHALREHGLMKIEGKEYVVQDGDVLYIRFNV